jgi:predicted hydrolase (HD superfamily)|tara:strand:- start:2233 stop:2871 length:639 start_codon:yes stop_codon:yes gene_type:complete
VDDCRRVNPVCGTSGGLPKTIDTLIGMSMTVETAIELMHTWVESPALRQHMECVAACMTGYARKVAPDQADHWRVCGLLHDFDYERHPTQEEHPFVGVAHLRERGDVDDEIIDAILGHATYSGVPRESAMAKHLFAVDELAGFIVAVCKVRPAGIEGLKPKSVRKKLKTANFAAAVSREDIALGCAELGCEQDELIQGCIDAMSEEAEALGL